MKNLLGIFMIIILVIIGCEKECEVTNPENLKFNGCFNFMVFDSIKVIGLENSYVSIQVQREELDLNNQFKSFEIRKNSSITSAIQTFNMETNDCYCSDVVLPGLKTYNTWIIQSGAIEIRIVRERSDCDDTYVVDVILKNAIFKDLKNNEILIEYKAFLNILVNYTLG
jgi:hypothetical protein